MSQQKVLVYAGPFISSCANIILLYISFLDFEKVDEEKKIDNRQIMRSNVDTYGWRINIYSPGMYLSYIILNWQCTRNEKWTMQCGYVWRDKSCLYISYGYLYFAYVLFLYGFHQKDIFFCFIMFSSIYIKSINYGPKLKGTILNNLCYIIILYFAFRSIVGWLKARFQVLYFETINIILIHFWLNSVKGIMTGNIITY